MQKKEKEREQERKIPGEQKIIPGEKEKEKQKQPFKK